MSPLFYQLSLCLFLAPPSFSFFFFNDTATTEIYTLSLHDALPIRRSGRMRCPPFSSGCRRGCSPARGSTSDRKSTRLNSSHTVISYAVFCLKKKKPAAAISRLLTDKEKTV